MTTLDNKTRLILSDPIRRRVWVGDQLKMMGTSLAELAADAGVSRQCIYSAFYRNYPRMESLIARKLGLSAADIFPERFDDQGVRLSRIQRNGSVVNKKNFSSVCSGGNVNQISTDIQDQEN